MTIREFPDFRPCRCFDVPARTRQSASPSAMKESDLSLCLSATRAVSKYRPAVALHAIRATTRCQADNELRTRIGWCGSIRSACLVPSEVELYCSAPKTVKRRANHSKRASYAGPPSRRRQRTRSGTRARAACRIGAATADQTVGRAISAGASRSGACPTAGHRGPHSSQPCDLQAIHRPDLACRDRPLDAYGGAAL